MHTAAGYVTGRANPQSSLPPDHAGAPTERDAPAVEPVPTPSNAVPRASEPLPVAPAEEPTRVSEEPTLVAEFAEPGAEDGAGAELHIREPWTGYWLMTAREVTTRLPRASSAELAAVQLYESNNLGRQTILAAVVRQLTSERQLSRATGGRSQR